MGEEHLTNSWLDYVQGVTWVLRRSSASLTGFEVTIDSSIPVGAGVSSSAALAVSLLRLLRRLLALPLDANAVAKLVSGGAIVGLVEAGLAGEVAGTVGPAYQRATGRYATVLLGGGGSHAAPRRLARQLARRREAAGPCAAS